MFCHHSCSAIPVLPPFPFLVLRFSFPCSVISMFYHHSMFSHSLLCFSHSPSPQSSFPFPFSAAIPCSVIPITPSPHRLSHSPLPANLIPIPTCISRLAKIKLKKQAPRGFEPATPQANILVATTTPHVCLCQYLLQ